MTSYFGMRKIEVRKDAAGVERIFLNNSPLFMIGPLDQGWWPDGLYTAPTDEALRSDIEMLKKMGFNMCRKHVKVEPARWYYWCDKLGFMVWQDMPSAMIERPPHRRAQGRRRRREFHAARNRQLPPRARGHDRTHSAAIPPASSPGCRSMKAGASTRPTTF